MAWKYVVNLFPKGDCASKKVKEPHVEDPTALSRFETKISWNSCAAVQWKKERRTMCQVVCGNVEGVQVLIST